MGADRAICLLALICGCHASAQHDIPIAPQPIETNGLPDHTTGPTELAKIAGGYELKNRLFRVVISDQTGDLNFWGYAGQTRNLLGSKAIHATLTNLPDTTPRGTVEMRDEETWQFFGEDDNHITWRKIYSLHGESLFVSIMIQNGRPDPLVTNIEINGDLPGLKPSHHDPELLEGSAKQAGLMLRGFNEFPAPTSRPALPTLIYSDTFHLKPQERQSYTTQWKLSAP